VVDTAGDFEDTRVIRQAFTILAGGRPTGPSPQEEFEELVASWTTRPASVS
jgi:hypothetical protein